MSDKYDWPMTDAELAKTLGLATGTVRRHATGRMKQRLEKGEDYLQEPHPANGQPVRYWKQKGAIKVASTSRRRAAKDFLEDLDIAKRQRSSVESDCLSIIAASLKGFTSFQRERAIGPYKIDLDQDTQYKVKR